MRGGDADKTTIRENKAGGMSREGCGDKVTVSQKVVHGSIKAKQGQENKATTKMTEKGGEENTVILYQDRRKRICEHKTHYYIRPRKCGYRGQQRCLFSRSLG